MSPPIVSQIGVHGFEQNIAASFPTAPAPRLLKSTTVEGGEARKYISAFSLLLKWVHYGWHVPHLKASLPMFGVRWRNLWVDALDENDIALQKFTDSSKLSCLVTPPWDLIQDARNLGRDLYGCRTIKYLPTLD